MSAKHKNIPDRPGQMLLGKQFLVRPLNPTSSIQEPDVWFQNLRLLKRLDLADPTSVVRDFQFRTGVNVLWAEPERVEGDTKLYEDGFAGHATGKTLFCRILRYILGERDFGTDLLKDNLQAAIPEMWAVATVRLKKKTWIVGRVLSGPGNDFAVPEGAYADVNTQSPLLGGYEEFKAELNANCGPELLRLYAGDPWRYVLPWLARDQEARFAGITEWRESRCGSENPRWSLAGQHLMLRATLGLITDAEIDLRGQLDQLTEYSKITQTEMPQKLQRTADQKSTVTALTSLVPKLSLDLTDLRSAAKQLDEARSQRTDSLENLAQHGEGQALASARDDLRKAERTQVEAQTRIASLEEQIQVEKGLIGESQELLKCLQDKGYADEAATLAAISKKQAQSLKSKQQELKKLVSQADALQAEVNAKAEAVKNLLGKDAQPILKIQKEISHIEAAQTVLKLAQGASRDEQSFQQKQTTVREGIEVQRSKIEKCKYEAASDLKPISDIFGDVIQGVLGPKVNGMIELGERIELKAKKTSELGGAALETIKTLAFDLAALIASVEGKGYHPRLLIHDGPRESDMARIIYERLFKYMVTIEECFQETNCPFQYIITTTTPPPTNMQEGSRWLLGDVLSSNDPKRRLLKAEF